MYVCCQKEDEFEMIDDSTLKTLKINGEISLPAKLSLNDFCKLFNRFQDENGLGFNGFITEQE